MAFNTLEVNMKIVWVAHTAIKAKCILYRTSTVVNTMYELVFFKCFQGSV